MTPPIIHHQILSLKVLTPQSTLLELDGITMVVCPGVEGDLGIMANHLPLVTTLRTGTLKVYKEHAVIFSMMIDSSQSGILNVSTKNVTVLLETFCPIQFDANIHGAELMQTPLRIESPLYGEYKIDNEVFAALTPNYRGLLQNHLSKHKVGCITKNFLHSLGRRAA